MDGLGGRTGRPLASRLNNSQTAITSSHPLECEAAAKAGAAGYRKAPTASCRVIDDAFERLRGLTPAGLVMFLARAEGEECNATFSSPR